MRLRNLWLDGPSFFIALFMVWGAVFSIAEYFQTEDADLPGLVRPLALVINCGLFLFAAAVFFWVSWRVGDTNRRCRESRQRLSAKQAQSDDGKSREQLAAWLAIAEQAEPIGELPQKQVERAAGERRV